MRLEFRHLEIVVAVAEAGSIRRAATALQMSQPALSAQLQRIEQEFGRQLFTRGREGITPTEAGQYVLAHAKELLTGLGQLQVGVKLGGAESEPTVVRVGGVSGVLVPLLVDILGDFLPARPVSSTMQRSITVLCRMLERAEIDIAVLQEYPGFPVRLPDKVAERSLIVEPVFIAMSENHTLADRPEIELADLAEEDWAMPATDDSGLHGSMRVACESAGFAPRFTHWALDSAAALALVARGHTVCGLYPTSFPIPGTVMRPLAGNPLHRRLFLAWRVDSPIASFVTAARDAVLVAYQELMHQRPHYDAWWARHKSDFPQLDDA